MKYNFCCKECEHEFLVTVPMVDGPPKWKKCPECEGIAHHVLVTPNVQIKTARPKQGAANVDGFSTESVTRKVAEAKRLRREGKAVPTRLEDIS